MRNKVTLHWDYDIKPATAVLIPCIDSLMLSSSTVKNLLAIMGLKSKIADVDIPKNVSWPQFVFQNFEQYGEKTAIVSTDKLLSSSKRNKFGLRCCFSESSRILTSFSYRCLTARKREDAEISTSTCYKKSQLQQILIHLTFKLSELVDPTSIGSCIL